MIWMSCPGSQVDPATSCFIIMLYIYILYILYIYIYIIYYIYIYILYIIYTRLHNFGFSKSNNTAKNPSEQIPHTTLFL